jgi:uncharacterized protein (DUF302 family)
MIATRTIAIDLPQKILICEDADGKILARSQTAPSFRRPHVTGLGARDAAI